LNKNAIQKYAVWARNELIEQVKQRAYQYGISEKGYGDENATVVAGRVLSADEKRQRHSFVKEIKEFGYKQVIEEVAYTWFNRFVALRYMEVNDFLPTHVRVFSDSSGSFKPEILTNVLHLNLPGLDKAKVSELLNANATEELYRYLLLTQCNALNELLPEMFERMGAFTEMLLPTNILKPESVIGRLVKDIPEEDFRDAVQIIGWLYQYYNTEPKQAVFDGLKNNVKITKENIPAATQLFTPDWIVRYMVENSLGRIFIGSRLLKGLGSSIPEAERVQKEKEIADEMGWKYYLPEAEQSSEVRAQLLPTPYSLLPIHYSLIPVEDLKILDPCMGSGHILVYAFDVLMQIYTSEGYSERDAAKLILEKNLYGLEIDRRAYQLAYFALMMKARQYNRRILTLGVRPQLYEPTGYADGMEYGSLVRVDKLEPMPELPKKHQMAWFDDSYETKLNTWNFRRLLAQKYDVVVTNPPYMGSSGMGAKLSEFVKNNYPDSKSDLFSAFIERGLELIKTSGYNCMVTMQSWMFLSSFETMRKKILSTRTITNLLHMENMVMGIAFGTAVANLYGLHIADFKGQYNYITMKDIEDETPVVFPTTHMRNCTASTQNFEKIPDSPVAYWMGEKFVEAFGKGKSVDSISDFTGSQNITSDNERFLRFFWEVAFDDIGKSKHWAYYAKGGEYRRWYGNVEYVVDTSSMAMSFYKNNSTANRLADKYWFTEGITYSAVTSKGTGFRYYPAVGGFDKGGATICYVKNLLYVLAALNSNVAAMAFTIFNPTINLQIKDVKAFPIIVERLDTVERIAKKNIALSRVDWDAFETSWEFKRHPLIYGERTIAAAFAKWEQEAADRFDTLKANEEELNRIFIDIYGLKDELTPEVKDKDVTVRRADLGREIRSLISYAVGSMFGRYSPYKDGLIYAGGEWNIENFKQLLPTPYSLLPDSDNILPICDDEYFDDDIIGRFVAFVKTVYGKDTLEENLKFIADALGGNGTPREAIRKYFLNDFYKDHVKVYQKRPIYWLFDSGRRNGFKALIYMHRYSRDLLAKMRTDYVHEQQERYRTQLSHIVGALNTATSAERARLLKQQDKLSEQAREIGAYEEKVHHLADMHITIDLDGGVKKNYAIFDDVLAKI